MNLSHKIRLLPNKAAEHYFRCASGVARFAWNWALGFSNQQYKLGTSITSGYSLRNHFNSIKREKFPWAQEVTKWASQKPIEDLGRAFKEFFKGTKGFPKFKKKNRSKRSFYFASPNVEGNQLRIPNFGIVKMTEEIRFPGTPKSVTITECGGKWFASFLVELDDSFEYPHCCENQAVVGIDLGIKTLATLSDETKYENPKLLARSARKVRRLQKSLARKQKGSNNRKKAVKRLQRAYWKLRERRKTAIHEITTTIVRDHKYIVIEDLNVSGMMKNGKLAKAIADASFYEFRRQLEYKAELAGSEVIIVDRFFPSSKLCSCCDYKHEDLKLSDRFWECPSCGAFHDRDINAAKNLENEGYRIIVARESEIGPRGPISWETLNACGEDVRLADPRSRKGADKPAASMKQELSSSEPSLEGRR